MGAAMNDQPLATRRQLLCCGLGGLATLSATACRQGERSLALPPEMPKSWGCGSAPPDAPEGRVFETFLPNAFDRRRDDVSPFLTQAAAWSARERVPVIVGGQFHIGNPAIIDTENSHLHFDCAGFSVSDSGRRITTRYGRSVPIGIYVVADKVRLTGDCQLAGRGRPGQTLLNGIYGEEVSGLELGNFVLSNMALGMHLMCCSQITCGDLRAIGMWGMQPTNDGGLAGAGSAQIVSGCSNSVFGRLLALQNDKPARYLSTGKRGGKEPLDNVSNRFGKASVSGRQGSPWSQAMGLRSSVDSVFQGGNGQQVSFLLNVQQYLTDESYHVDNNDFGDWDGMVLDAPPSSVDAGINILIEKGAKPLGRNRIGSVSAEMAPMATGILQRLGLRYPQNFGLWCNSGEWSIDRIATRGFAHAMHIEDCDMRIGQLHVLRPEAGVVRFGGGARASIARLDVASAISGPAGAPAFIQAIATGSAASPAVNIRELAVAPGADSNVAVIIDDRAFPGSASVGTVRQAGQLPLRGR
jgi:hypothetical protein